MDGNFNKEQYGFIYDLRDKSAAEEERHACAGLVCAVTGARPANFPWNYYGENRHAYLQELHERVKELIDGGVTCFISGMAMGVDIDVAETVLEIKREQGNNIRLVCAIPCPDQQKLFSQSWKARYTKILRLADERVLVSRTYSRQCFLDRNRYMADRCDVLFAVWNGSQTGGTAYTIKYAQKTGKRICILDLNAIGRD